MSNFFHNFILDEEQRDETFNIIDVALPNPDEFYPLLTCDQYEDIEAYYIFNRIKIWQKKMECENKPRKYKTLKLLLSILLILTIPFGILFGIHEYEVEKSYSYSIEHPTLKFKEMSIKERIKTLIKVCF